MGGFNASAFNPPTEPEVSRQASQAQTASAQNGIQPFSASAPSQPFKVLVTKLSTSARRLGEGFCQLWIADDQPQVKWWRDAQGHDHYSVYDPHSQNTHDFETAHEVRVWLEQRYYE